jgi:eukaryotic-like serine/threonine-protein kinase
MPLATGSRLGPYEIVAAIGAGGMGEVYRARDAKLGRDVAIKILPEALAADPVALARFEREAQAVAALSHPNVLSIHDFGVERGAPYAVMELLEGQTLRGCMGGGSVPPRKAVEYALQIAAGLGAAHARGITHRDLKPENVFVMRDGHVKILDFGLAKQRPAASADAAVAATRNLETGPGMVMGTVGYMAPEQLRGQEVDPRTDIFAFGAVLYEMLAGRRAFQGATPADTASAILNQDPPELTTLAAVQVLPALDRIVRRCLEKNPDERFHSARDVAFALEAVSGSGVTSAAAVAVTRSKSLSGRLAWLICGALIVSVPIGLYWWRHSTPAEQTMHFSPPFAFAARDAAIAPNGHTVAVVGYRDSARRDVIWLYEVGSQEAKDLADTEGATCPFWSADGKFLAFFADGKLKKIPVAGGPAQTLCEASSGRGGTWNQDGVIIFSPSGDLQSGLYRIPDSGGTKTLISTPDASRGEDSHRWPIFLPDGKHYLYLAATFGGGGDADALYMGLLDSNEKRLVLKTPANAAYVSPGYLIFYRDGTLFGQRFDLDTLKLAGEPIAILTEIQYLSRIARAVFAVSDNGLLVAQKSSEASLSRLVWFDRKGNEVGVVGTPDTYANVVLARNGKAVAVDKVDSKNQNDDVFTCDLQCEGWQRLTFDPGNDAMPVWSPNGDRLAFSSNRRHVFDLYVKNADGAEEERLIEHSDTDKYPNDWSPDGKSILYTRGKDLWVLTFPELKSRLFKKAPSTLKNGQFSPDGKWVAYTSNESGKWEIYVTDFPEARGKWQVSTGGGEQPRWSRGGNQEIFFISPENRLMAALVKAGTGFNPSTPTVLFQLSPREIVASHEHSNYDVDQTGQRFLVNTSVKKVTSQPLSIVLNWNAGLKK